MLVLGTVAALERPTYGYRVVQELERGGFGKVKGGTLYPILARLEQRGWITSSWGEGDGGPGRKYVEITLEGRAQQQQALESWEMFRNAIDGGLSGVPPSSQRVRGLNSDD